jgi:hypothetical protein
MGTMSASDAAPLPRAGEVFFDVRGNSRTMRVSWYGDTGIAVFSIWQGGTCTGTFRLPIPELPRIVEALSHGPSGGVGPIPPGPQAGLQPSYPGPQAGYPGAQEAGPPTAAMGPAGGYAGMPPADCQDPRHLASQMDAQPGGYQEAALGGYAEAPAGGYGYQDARPGYGDASPGYPDAPHGYEDAGYGYTDAPSEGYQDVPAAGYHDAPAAGYQDAPAAGYRDAPAAGYQDAAAAGYQPAGYAGPSALSDQPGQAGYAGQAPFSAGQGTARTPSGPLPVGRWHEGEHTAAYPGTAPAPPAYPGTAPAPGGYGGADPGYHVEPEYQPDPVAEGMAEDPLGGDYAGEAEQGYLPGPPTQTFRPVAVGSHSRQAGQQGPHQPAGYQAGGYEPDQGQPAENSAYEGSAHEGSAYEDSDYSGYTRAEDSPPESLAYHPGHAGPRDREYRPSRGRS